MQNLALGVKSCDITDFNVNLIHYLIHLIHCQHISNRHDSLVK